MERDPFILPDYEEKFEIDFEEPTIYWECEIIKCMGVWKLTPRSKNEKIIIIRWVDKNKGDEIKRYNKFYFKN